MFLKTDTFKIKDGIPWQQDGEKALILDADEHFAHELNSTALFIWKNIKSQINFEELFIRFVNEYEGNQDDLKKDLNDTLNNLKQLKLVEVNPT